MAFSRTRVGTKLRIMARAKKATAKRATRVAKAPRAKSKLKSAVAAPRERKRASAAKRSRSFGRNAAAKPARSGSVRANAPSAPGHRGRAGLEEVRRLCLALPEADEQEAWGDPTFRVRNKIFAMHKVGDGRQSIWCKAGLGAQQALTDANSELFFVPPYVGHHGWIGIRLDHETPWLQVAALLRDAYRLTAPKTLLRSLER
jgi:predicted DNA-binding protein (MmcQ/YjbR family)